MGSGDRWSQQADRRWGSPHLPVALHRSERGTDRAALYRTYLGRCSLLDAHRRGDIEAVGSGHAVHAFFAAFRQSPVAEIVARGAV